MRFKQFRVVLEVLSDILNLNLDRQIENYLIQEYLNIDIKPILVYLEKCGLKSLGII